MFEEFHHIRDAHYGAPLVVNGDIFIGAVKVLLGAYAKVERCAFVACIFHLVDVPVGAEQRCVGYSHVCAHVFHFLGIP